MSVRLTSPLSAKCFLEGFLEGCSSFIEISELCLVSTIAFDSTWTRQTLNSLVGITYLNVKMIVLMG